MPELVRKHSRIHQRKVLERNRQIRQEGGELGLALDLVAQELTAVPLKDKGSFIDLPISARREACRSSILAWGMNCRPRQIQPYKHSCLLDQYLVRCFTDDRRPYLMISMPPRSGKTLMTTILGATWYLGHNPDHNVFCVSYSAATAGDFGREAKLLWQQFAGEIWGLEIDPRSRGDNKWRIKGHEGGFHAVGWGGAITGQRVNLMIVDDLIKNDDEALSPRIRDKIWSWWQGTASQRIQNNPRVRTRVCSIQTRWTVQDLNGRLIDHERGGSAMRWDKLILPALAEDADILVDGEVLIPKGQSLCEELIPLRYLVEEVKPNTSRFWWNAQFQQRPLTQDGILWGPEMFPDDRLVDSWPSRLMHLVVALDPATGLALRDGDYSAIVAIGMDTSGRVYVSADMEKSGPVQTIQRLDQFIRTLPRKPDIIAVEDQGFQFLMTGMAADYLASTGLDETVVGYTIPERGVASNKVDRITDLDALITNQDLNFVRSPGTSLLLRQLQNFPSRDHDDGPDALELGTWVLAQI